MNTGPQLTGSQKNQNNLEKNQQKVFHVYLIAKIYKKSSHHVKTVSNVGIPFLKVSKSRKQNSKFSHTPKHQQNFVHILP